MQRRVNINLYIYKLCSYLALNGLPPPPQNQPPIPTRKNPNKNIKNIFKKNVIKQKLKPHGAHVQDPQNQNLQGKSI
jgi:hypothetical protein